MSRSDRILIAAGGGALVLAAAAGFVLLSPPVGATDAAQPDPATLLIGTPGASSASTATPEATAIVVDVEGAVVEPGIRELPPGSRVADALAAAGGYAPDADLEAAASALNLARLLEDGAQILVPRVGATAFGDEPRPPAESGAPAAGHGQADGLVDLNTASAEELDALPGIGPVTVDRIIQARAEQPFSSLQDAVDRGALDRGQLRKIEGRATAD